MFSRTEKRRIAEAVEKVLREIAHPEMPAADEPIDFTLHVNGKESWSYADIRSNRPAEANTLDPNPWNEVSRLVLEQIK